MPESHMLSVELSVLNLEDCCVRNFNDEQNSYFTSKTSYIHL